MLGVLPRQTNREGDESSTVWASAERFGVPGIRLFALQLRPHPCLPPSAHPDGKAVKESRGGGGILSFRDNLRLDPLPSRSHVAFFRTLLPS